MIGVYGFRFKDSGLGSLKPLRGSGRVNVREERGLWFMVSHVSVLQYSEGL